MTNTNLSLIQKTTNQVVEETKDRRIAKSMVVAMSCEIVRLESEKETYKVQSETNVDKYYIVKFMDGTPVFCSCKDFEIQSQKNRNHICKHQRAIVLAENYGLVTTKQKLQNNVVEVLLRTCVTNVIEDSSIINDDEDDGSSYCQSQHPAKFEGETIMMTKTTTVARPRSSYKIDDYTF